MTRARVLRQWWLTAVVVFTLIVSLVPTAPASTYVVYIPVDDPIYQELDTLDGLGLLDSYISEVKPISRVEAARLVIEARDNLSKGDGPDPLAAEVVKVLSSQLAVEMSWLEQNEEDRLPTMVRPIQRLEARYVYSSGERRKFYVQTNSGKSVNEATPLLSGNSDLPTASGNNGAAIWEGWAGIGGFLTGYGEGALAGPLREDHNAPDRDRIVSGGAVVSLGNVAVSFGNEQMEWGVGHFTQLSQSTNASAFPALRVQNVHPGHLPWILRYLGPFRAQAFFGQLDNNRTFSSPWIDGEIVAFKPLPSFEFGFTHAITFGGKGNDNYNAMQFLGKATGISTGSLSSGNTNSRVSAYTKVRLQRLRGTQLYGEILGEDYFQPFGHGSGPKLPFKAPSYQAGVYVPRVTKDGLTDARLEWTLLDRDYSTHNDSLYWTYDGRLMGDPLGPHAQRIEGQIGRWFDLRYKLSVAAYYEMRRPVNALFGTNTENGEGFSVELLRLPIKFKKLDDAMADCRVSTGLEYLNDVNYLNHNSLRAMVTISIGLTPRNGIITWR